MIRALTVLAAGLLLSGCTSALPLASAFAPRLGQPPVEVHSQTSVVLAKDDFVLLRTNLVGCSKGFSLLGLITIYPPTLTQAMNRLYSASAIQEGKPQTLAHLVIEQSSSFWILFAIPQVSVRADLVQFNPALEPKVETLRPSPENPPPR